MSTVASATIVVAIHSSAHREDALSIAAALARRHARRLVLAPGDEDLRARERGRIEAAAGRLRASGLEVEDLFEEGARGSALLAARRAETQLLIVAVDANDPAAAERAFRLSQTVAPVPTLVLRDPKPILGWVRGRRKLRALACVDASAAGRATLRKLAELHRIGAVDAAVVHVVVPRDEHARLGLTTNVPHRGLLPIVERSVAHELRGWAEQAGLLTSALSFTVARAHREVATQLVSLAREREAELVVVGVSRATAVATLLRPSALKALVARAGNVLCVPAPPITAATPVPVLRSVLVATDLTPEGDAAISYAYALVSRPGVVHLVHALVEPAEDAKDVMRRLRALVPASARAEGINTEVHAPVGIDVVPILTSTAERLAVDAICLSTTPRSSARKAFSGSIAEAMLRHNRRPVLMVPPQRHER